MIRIQCEHVVVQFESSNLVDTQAIPNTGIEKIEFISSKFAWKRAVEFLLKFKSHKELMDSLNVVHDPHSDSLSISDVDGGTIKPQIIELLKEALI